MPAGAGLSAAAQAGIACFVLALVWWVCEPFPTYVTSLVLMFLLLVTRASNAKAIMDVLGMEVIWLNLLAFILASMLVKTRLARRIALALVLRFGATAGRALLAFLLLQMVLAPLIPATAARCVMTLPLMMVVAAIYGSTEDSPKAFGKNLMLLNLVGISILSSMTMTGSSANLIAVGLIQAMGGHRVYYMDWVRMGAPIAIVTALLMWWLGQKLIFRIPENERTPALKGGLDVIRSKYAEMGPLSTAEKKSIAIFGLVLFLWMTDVFHLQWFGVEITAPFAALLGAVIVLFPRWGVLQWSEADIPWHLLIFSAGAYAGGLALDDTGAAEWAVRMLFGRLDLQRLPFGAVFTLVTAVMMYSHLLTTSKTVRTIIMIPIIIALAKTSGLGAGVARASRGALHRLGGRPSDQRQAERDPLLDEPVFGAGQLQVRHRHLHDRSAASGDLRSDLVPLAGDHPRVLGGEAMKRFCCLALVLFCAAVAGATEISSYDVLLLVAEDGRASGTAKIAIADAQPGPMAIPLGFAATAFGWPPRPREPR